MRGYTDHDRIVRLDTLVAEHERQLRAINGHLDRIEKELADVKENHLTNLKSDVNGLKTTIKVWASGMAAVTSGVMAIVVWAITNS